MKKTFTFLISLLMIFMSYTQATVYYVKMTGNDYASGTSWQNAFSTLEKAILAAQEGDEIWVAQGTYQPPHYAPYKMKSGVSIYGGFEGAEIQKTQRDWQQNAAILRGNGSSVIRNDFTQSNPLINAYLDGFIVEGGSGSNIEYPDTYQGGGIYNCYATLTLANCTIRNCNADMGGGVYNLNSSISLSNCLITQCKAYGGAGLAGTTSSISLKGCVIVGCSADKCGGAIYSSQPVDLGIFMTTINNNSAYAYGGGICVEKGNNNTNSPPIYIVNSRMQGNRSSLGGALEVTGKVLLEIHNSLITGNFAEEYGGAINLRNVDDMRMINTTIAGNFAGMGGGIMDMVPSANGVRAIFNTIIWGNRSGYTDFRTYNMTSSSVTYGYTINPSHLIPPDIDMIHSLVESEYGYWNQWSGNDIMNNITEDPLFVHFQNATFNSPTDQGDFHVCFLSSTVNAGENAIMDNSGEDLDGNLRIVDNTIDMGAYEHPLTNRRIYVNAQASGIIEDGLTWETAYQTLADALVKAIYTPIIDEIWVAAGYYLNANAPYPLGESYRMMNNLEIYGGFAGNETELKQRKWKENPTYLAVIDGYHIISNSYSADNRLDHSAVLDGFILSGANTNRAGGAIYNLWASPTIRNCIIEGCKANEGGGMYNDVSSSPKIYHTVFRRNTAKQGNGGAVYNTGYNTEFIQVQFLNNYAKLSGGGIYGTSTVALKSCLVAYNYAEENGGGIMTSGCSLNGVTLTMNYCKDGLGGGLHCEYKAWEQRVIINSIIWGNYNGTNGINNLYCDSRVRQYLSVSYTLLQASSLSWSSEFGLDHGNNIDDYPLFRNYQYVYQYEPYAEGDFRLQSGSVAINSGNNNMLPSEHDLDGNPRISDEIVDMGAYEHMHEQTRIYVDLNATGYPVNGENWERAYPTLTQALEVAANRPEVEEIWVASGLYPAPQGSSYVMLPNVAVYGGFVGNETRLDQRDWEANETILSADGVSIIYNNYTLETSLHNAVLDGFTLLGGGDENTLGGGIYNRHAHPIIRNCRIQDCQGHTGGGMYNDHSAPQIINTVFWHNLARQNCGGAVYNINSSPLLIYVSLLNNRAAVSGGGIYHNSSGKMQVHSSLIACNYAQQEGGGILSKSKSELYNVTITGNFALNGAGIRNIYVSSYSSSQMSVYNSIIWGNHNPWGRENIVCDYWATYGLVHSQYCLLEGSSNWSNEMGSNYGYNLDSDPLFADYQYITHSYLYPEGNYRLSSQSPAINRGNNNTIYYPYDRDGGLRTQGNQIDMGAYEFSFGKYLPQPLDLVRQNDSWMKVYPNPVVIGTNATVEINLAGDDYAGSILEIYNAVGALIQRIETDDPVTSITMPQTKGHYYIKAVTKDGSVKMKKIIVM